LSFILLCVLLMLDGRFLRTGPDDRNKRGRTKHETQFRFVNVAIACVLQKARKTSGRKTSGPEFVKEPRIFRADHIYANMPPNHRTN
jgi:hypothetical protein